MSKKIVSVILSIVLLVSCLFVQVPTILAKEGVWNGTTLGGEILGGGTESNPFLIDNAEQLAWAVSNGGNGRYYMLTTDIYLNEIDNVDWSDGSVKGYTPRSWYSFGSVPTFSGTIDGNGHVIYGLYYNNTDSKFWEAKGSALLPGVGLNQTATIKNLGISNAYINDRNAVSAFVGYSRGNVILENCFLSESVTLSGYETGAFFGLSSGEFKISNCYSLATLIKGIADDDACDIGLVGEFYSKGEAKIANCYLKNCYNAAGGGSTKNKVTNLNVYVTEESKFGTVLTPDQMKGAIYDGNQMLLGDAFVATDIYPALKVFCPSAGESWNGIGTPITEGSGTENDPYIIRSAGQLALALAEGGNGANYRLASDIWLNDIEKIDWDSCVVRDNYDYTPNYWFKGYDKTSAYYDAFSGQIKFSGNLDGGGHTVYGLLYEVGDYTTAGLIPAATSTTLKNLNLAYSYVFAGRFAGAVSSYFSGNIIGCSIESSVMVQGDLVVTADSSSVGGFVGWSAGIGLKDCLFDGVLYSKKASHTYGLIGTSWGTKIETENCISIDYQPFTVSMASKNFATKTAAENYYKNYNGYVVKNVYTDTNKKVNAAPYKYDSDGNGSYDTSGSYELFTFTNLTTDQLRGTNALENMPALSKEIWVADKTKAPVLKVKLNADADVNADGQNDLNDKTFLRTTVIGKTASSYTDVNNDASTDILDIVKLSKDNIYVVKNDSGNVVYTLDILPEKLEKYSVVYPANDATVEQYAKTLAEKLGVSCVADNAERSNFEIIVGLKEGEGEFYKTTLVGSKIYLYATGEFSLKKAVDEIEKFSEKGISPILRGMTYAFDTNITLSNGNNYSYVWGDEFSGTAINPLKWNYAVSGTNMGACNATGLPADIKVLSNEQVQKVVDGNLRLTAIEYTEEGDENIKYGVPASVRSRERMEYRYGYAEIRAKVPFKTGVWPSYWSGESNALGGESLCDSFSVEVDVFEIMGTPNIVVPNLHKWYKNHDPATHGCTYTGTHSSSGTDKKYYFENYENLSNEYHTYGFEWTPTEMSMYVDGYCYKTYDITKSFDKCPDMTGFHDPRYIIFNNHVFSPNSKFKPNCIEGHEENLPANYDIDYFRLYQDQSVAHTAIWTKKNK